MFFFLLFLHFFFIITSSITIFDHIVFSWPLACLVFAAFFLSPTDCFVLLLLLLLLFLSFPSLLFSALCTYLNRFEYTNHAAITRPRTNQQTHSPNHRHSSPSSQSSQQQARFTPRSPPRASFIAWTRALKSRQVLLGCAPRPHKIMLERARAVNKKRV